MLYVVGTPIGNLKDLSPRALEVLKSVGILLAESPEDSRPLLNFYDIKPKKIIKYNEENRKKITPAIMEILEKEDVVLITSAGMPGVSDPVADLVSECYKKSVAVAPIPGPSALSAAIAVSGIYAKGFLFVGFLSRKTGDIVKLFNEAAENDHALVFFESPFRLVKTIQLLEEKYPSAEVFLGKEMTKKFEKYLKMTPAGISAIIKENKDFLKGEFTLIVKFS